VLIQRMALKCEGAPGPSCLGASEWSSSFGPSSTDLCCAIAAATRRLCVDFVDPCCLHAFVDPCCLHAFV